MERELRFRVWDGNQMLLSPSEIEFLGSWFDAHAPGALYKGGKEFMQFTGLKDKNGSDIYEGDIVSFCMRMYEVKIYFNGYHLQRYKLWRGKFVPAHTYSLSLITKPSKDRFGGEVDSAEVIGNIYENPELLTTKPTTNE